MKQFYTKKALSLLFLFFITLTSFAQNNSAIWSQIQKPNTLKSEQVVRKSMPIKSDYFQLNMNALQSILDTAPNRRSFDGTSQVIVDFPVKGLGLESFRIKEASVLAEELQSAYPNMRSYVGQSIKNPSTTIRFSITPSGLHTILFSSENGTQFIDPFSKNSNDYIIYKKTDLPFLQNEWICGVIDDDALIDRSDFDVDAARNANDGMMREYRLALASTIEYSSYHWMAAGLTAGDTVAAKKDAVLAAMVVTMTRVNGVYERDLSITMTIIANNKDIIFIDTDNFDNADANLLIGQSQSEIDAIIGSANYDIGHTFSTGGGGLASLNSPCINGSKASGITGSPAPVGDAYDIDYVAHEMGHQFGAPHTFNGDAGNCAGGNRTGTNAYEVGSGSTIMAYAGICAPQNVQSNSDAYFHQKSLQMIWANVSSGNSSTCASLAGTSNAVPTANAGADYVIPMSTPYKLTGSSTDADGITTHTYTWEEYDLGPAGLPLETNATGPMVRSYEGTTGKTRYIPRMEDILSLGSISTVWEKLASVDRDLNFALTVRDNDTRGGQTAVDYMKATVTSAAGPFVITSQGADQIVWTPGTSETITWLVSGTDANGVNTPNVNILLSTDQGVTFDTVLASNVPNNGSYTITVPNITAPYCRIMVEGAGNIFFDINDNFLAIGDYSYVQAPETCQDYTFNAGISIVENASSYTGYGLTIPDTFTITDVDVNVKITTANNADLAYAIREPSAAQTFVSLATTVCAGAANTDLIFDDEGVAINCASTNAGDHVIPQDALSAFDGLSSNGDWVFFITDVNVDGTISTWDSITLTLCQGGGFMPVLDVDDFESIEGFNLYPNPNNGEFRVTFNQVKSDRVDVQLYDLLGRSILQKSYSNLSVFDQTINIKNVSAGIYILKVKDGDRQISQKVIID